MGDGVGVATDILGPTALDVLVGSGRIDCQFPGGRERAESKCCDDGCDLHDIGLVDASGYVSVPFTCLK